MTQDPKLLQALVAVSAPPDMAVTFRPMFGGIMAYAEGKPFASLSDAGLALKLAGANHAALLAVPGAEPLRYAPDQPSSKTYVVVPEAMLAARDDLRSWMARCISGLPTPRPKRSRA